MPASENGLCTSTFVVAVVVAVADVVVVVVAFVNGIPVAKISRRGPDIKRITVYIVQQKCFFLP